VDKALSDAVENQLRSVFPEGTLTQVDVLGYGDDPDVEPGETAVRAFVGRAGHPAGSFQDDENVLQAFEQANGPGFRKLHDDGLLPAVAWVQLIPDTPARRAPGAVLWGFPSMSFGMRADVADEAPDFASVRTRLSPADLATVDALIAAGVAASRAEVLRWAIGRIRENPAYAQIRERVRETGDLRAQL
jgi:hypothetical protein